MPARTTARTTARPTRRATTRRPSGASKTAANKNRRKAAAARKATPVSAVGLPGWGDLGAKGPATNPKKARAAGRARFLDAAPSLRFGVYILLACILMTLYVGHVYATQATLAQLQQARRENLRLHLTHERLQGAFDRMTGPDQILDRAAALGLEEGVAYGPAIRIDD